MNYHVLTPISFSLRLFEVLAEFFMVSVFLNCNVKVKKILIYSFAFAVLIEAIRLVIPYSFYWVFTLLIPVPFLKKMLNVKFTKVVLAYFTTMIIVIILDVIITFLFVLCFKFPTINSMTGNLKFYYLGIASVFSFLFLLALIIKSLKNDHFNLMGIEKSNLLLNTLILSILIVPNIFVLGLYFDKQSLPIWIIFVNISSIVLMFFISIYNNRKLLRLVRSEEELSYQRNYNSTLQNLIDGLRTFKHDYSNTLQTINGYIQLDNMPALKLMMGQILDESRSLNSLDKLNPDLIKNPSIFGLITAKYQLCMKNNVAMNFEIFGDLENVDIQTFDLTRILGILLDNAIEAASGSEEHKMNFLISEFKKSVTIEISNTYSNNLIPIEKMFESGMSSKGDGRGLGLYEVSKILKKYPEIKLVTLPDGKIFLQKLVIPNRSLIKTVSSV